MRVHASIGEEEHALRRAAARARCSVEILAPIHGHVQGRILCDDGWSAARLLYELAREDAQSPGARAMAAELRQLAPDDDAYARLVHGMVKHAVRFRPEQGEIFQSLGYTLEERYGDCDDHARAVAALGWAGGLPTRMAFLHHPGGNPTHVAAQLGPKGRFQWAETTLDAHYGEHPLAGAERLKLLRGREDLAREVTIMSDDTKTMGAVSHTADLSDDFFAELKDLGAELGFDPVFALDIMWAESGIKPDAKYRDGKNKATGLIGFVDVHGLGAEPDNSLESHDDFATKSATEQLVYVRKFWAPMKGRVHSAANLYQYNFLPASLSRGTGDETVVAAADGEGYGGREGMFYRVNKLLDVDGNGAITVGDLAAHLERQKHTKSGGLYPRYAEALERLGGAAPIAGGGGGSLVGPAVALVAIGASLAYAWTHG